MTGLALLAYFGHCETPVSEEFGESCTKGIVYLVNVGMKNDGRLAADPHGPTHGLTSTASPPTPSARPRRSARNSKSRFPRLMEVTQKAGQFIIDNQNENGGWAYLYATERRPHRHLGRRLATPSPQGMQPHRHQVQRDGFLQSAKASNTSPALPGRERRFWLQHAESPRREPGYFSLTGVGVLCFQMWGKGNVRRSATA